MLAQRSLLCLQKPQMRAGTSRDHNSGANHADLHAQNDR